MSATLEVRGLTATHGAVPVVVGVSMTVAQGEIVVVLGPNGAGKTTLMRAIGGRANVTGGSVLVDGVPFDRGRPHLVARSGIAQVAAGRGVFRSLTVEQNLRVVAELFSPTDATDAVSRVCEQFPLLAARRSQVAATLSGGEQQMLAVARALVARPRFLLLDEPSTGLAAEAFAALLSVLSDVSSGDSVGVLLVEQQSEAALAIAHRGYLLRAGRIVGAGAPPELREALGGDESSRSSGRSTLGAVNRDQGVGHG